ncbi:MAG: caspase family protein [Cyanobacteria bacterium J06642_3]
MGKNWAIAIGINNYSNLRHLKYAEADAQAMGEWFKQEAKFEQVFYLPKIHQTFPPNLLRFLLTLPMVI